MTSWMKAGLAILALGAVAALAIMLASDPAAENDGGGRTPKSVAEAPPSAMELPEAPRSEAEAVVPEPLEEVARGDLVPDGAALDEAAAPEREVPTATLTGQIVDPVARPVAGARVVFHGPDDSSIRLAIRHRAGEEIAPPERPEATTDRSGRFTLEVPVPEDDDAERDDGVAILFGGEEALRLVVAHEAFATLIHDLPKLKPGKVGLGQIALEPGGQVVGRVVNDAGRPIAGAEVTARGATEAGGPGMMLRVLSLHLAELYNRATTGADGRFLVTGLLPGHATLSVKAENYQMGFVDHAEIEAGVTTDVGEIALAAGEMIAGYLYDDEGEPVEGATVRVWSVNRIIARRMEDLPRHQIGHEMSLRGITDAGGRFEIVGLGAGQYTVVAQAEGFAELREPNVSTGTTDLALHLSPLGTLLVTVLSEADGAPIGGAEVVAAPGFGRRGGIVISGAGGPTLNVVEDDDEVGLYRVEGAGPNGTQLTVRADGFATAEVDGPAVVAGETGSHVVHLRPEAVIAGRVVDTTSAPVADATVRITLKEPDDDGFSFGGGGFRREIRREVHRTVGGDDDGADDWRRVRTARDGSFEFRGVPAGNWEVAVRADDFVRNDSTQLTLAEGETRDDVEVVLAAAGSIAGLVMHHDGEPIAGAEVIVTPQTRSLQPETEEDDVRAQLARLLGDAEGEDAPRRANADGSGRFELDGLAPGRYEVAMAKSNTGMSMGGAMFVIAGMGGGDTVEGPDAQRMVTVEANEETWVELSRPAMAQLEGRVLAGGQPVEVALVRLNEADAFLPFGGQTAETDRFGRFVFEDVEPGDYKISTIVPGAALEESVDVSLDSGRTSQADIVFGGATLVGRVVDADTGEGAPDVTINVTPIVESAGEEQTISFGFTMVAETSDGGGGGTTMEIGGGPQSKVRSDANGEFELKYLDAGRYSIDTSGGGFAAADGGEFEVRDGEELDDMLIEVERGATVHGTVMSGASGLPLNGVPVSLAPAGSSGFGSQRMEMVEGGSYRFEGLEAGEYTLSVMGSGFGETVATETIRLDKGEVRTVNLTTES